MQQNMSNLIQIAEQLLGRKLKPTDGYTLEEIQKTEDSLGLAMPEALKHFYTLIGKVDMLTSSFERFLSLNELRAEDEKIIFLAENQEVCFWSTTTLGDAVWVKNDNDDDWIAEPIELLEFICLILYYNCAQGGFEFGGITDKENYPEIMESVQDKWDKVVQYNGLIIYAYQDNLIWYFYQNDYMPMDDGIYLSCRTQEGFDEINNSAAFNECFDEL